jgi:hypothetical protein
MDRLSDSTPRFHNDENIAAAAVRYRTDSFQNRILILPPYVDFRASPPPSKATGVTPLIPLWSGRLARLFGGAA